MAPARLLVLSVAVTVISNTWLSAYRPVNGPAVTVRCTGVPCFTTRWSTVNPATVGGTSRASSSSLTAPSCMAASSCDMRSSLAPSMAYTARAAR